MNSIRIFKAIIIVLFLSHLSIEASSNSQEPEQEFYDAQESFEENEEFFDCEGFEEKDAQRSPSTFFSTCKQVLGKCPKISKSLLTAGILCCNAALAAAHNSASSALETTYSSGDAYWYADPTTVSAFMIIGLIGSVASTCTCLWCLCCKNSTVPQFAQQWIFPEGFLGGKGTWFSRSTACCDCWANPSEEENDLESRKPQIQNLSVYKEALQYLLEEQGIEVGTIETIMKELESMQQDPAHLFEMNKKLDFLKKRLFEELKKAKKVEEVSELPPVPSIDN